MNYFYLSAGVLSTLAALVHVLGGEATLRQIPSTAFPRIANGDHTIAKQEIRFGWHMASVDLLILGIALLTLSINEVALYTDILARFIAILFIGYGLVIAILPFLSLRRIDTFIRMPQWLLAFIIAGLAWGGTL